MQLPRGFHRGAAVITTLDNNPWDMANFIHILQDLAFFHKAEMGEVMVFNPGKSHCEIIGDIFIYTNGIK